MIASLAAQDQIAGLMAETMPETILQFKFDVSTQDRIYDLVQKKKNNLISSAEKEELEKYLTYDMLIGLAKARALQVLKRTL